MLSPETIARDRMLKQDAMSQWLGLEILEIGPGHCTCKMTVREEMLNGFKIAHGGISFTFADSAFAFASNSRGQLAVSIETSINHLQKIYAGDELTAVAEEIQINRKIGKYIVKVANQEGKVVAFFNGLVHRSQKIWE